MLPNLVSFFIHLKCQRLQRKATVCTEMWVFYGRLSFFLWFPSSLESTCTQYLIIYNDVIANHLEYSLPSWESLTCGCLFLQEYRNVLISGQSCLFVLWLGSSLAPDCLDNVCACVCVTRPRL